MKRLDASKLGVCRILMFGFALLYYGTQDFTQWAHVPPVFWRPIAIARLLHVQYPSSASLLIVQWIFRAALLLSCVGLYTRAAIFVAGISGAYLIALPNNYGNVHRIDAAFVVALLFMALSRSGDAWSLDARIGKRAPVVWKFEYAWPVMLIRSLLAVVFFAAGFAKLRHRGLDWITTDSLAILLGEQSRLLEEPLFPAAGAWVAGHARLCSILAGMTVLLEISYPLALISKTARKIIPAGAVAMLISIRVLQGQAFLPLMALQLFWVDWPWLIEWISSQWRVRHAGRSLPRTSTVPGM